MIFEREYRFLNLNPLCYKYVNMQIWIRIYKSDINLLKFNLHLLSVLKKWFTFVNALKRVFIGLKTHL